MQLRVVKESYQTCLFIFLASKRLRSPAIDSEESIPPCWESIPPCWESIPGLLKKGLQIRALIDVRRCIGATLTIKKEDASLRSQENNAKLLVLEISAYGSVCVSAGGWGLVGDILRWMFNCLC